MTKIRLISLAMLVAFALGTCAPVVAQKDRPPEQPAAHSQYNPPPAGAVRRPGRVVVPASSVVRPQDAGVRSHTDYLIFVPEGRPMFSPSPDAGGETPASLGCVYKVGPSYAGCNPATGGTRHPSGGFGAIAIVDAYDNPNAESDLAFFSSYYGLPAATFHKIYANSSWGTLNGMTASCSGTPQGDTDWGGEEDLDIEWAHAMAPNAKIILVEACSPSNDDLFFAEQVAGHEVSLYGGGDVTNSYGSAELPTEVGTTDDVFYRYYWQKTSYFASAGDSGWGAQYPSSSPWVVSAGGTTINRDINGNYLSESCWSGSGGGVSQYETWQNPPDISNGMGPWTSFQYALFGQTARQTPDIAFDADPASGVNVYDTYGEGGWFVVGGTSLSSPALAGIVNAANNRLGQAPSGGFYSNAENNLIYSSFLGHITYQYYYDVTTGSNGDGHNAGVGYDQCTGVGTPRGLAYK